MNSPITFWNTDLYDQGPVATVTECQNRFEVVTAGKLDDCTKEALIEALKQWLNEK